HNNWDIPKTVTDGDFVSVNSTGVDGSRQADGSLPSISFLHLVAGSGLIDAGVDAGLAYIGTAPDLGAFEVQTSTVVQILNPVKGKSYENLSSIPIEALVSGSADIVTKVEFFNGSDKIIELTSAPYTCTWKEVPPGNYSITAIATDNSNNTTASAPVEFAVGSPVKNNASTNSDLISLFPNPNNGQFSIEFNIPLQNERSEIIITDLNGKQVYSTFISREEIVKQFDLSSINKGMYVLMVRDKQILVTKKFIKK
ncbi:MAG TPA: T9SS type A sorting domain-containing protein, partial [Bacteroidales bacterium]|nr:T9SS type A sorting domain-containing protein [Bacteroidales bacterium]